MARIAKYVLLLLVSSLVFGATIHSLQAAPTIEPLPPKVIDVSPLPGALLTPHDALTFTFDQPMDRQAVEAAFNISPRLDGLLNWTNSQTLTFSPQRWPLEPVMNFKLAI